MFENIRADAMRVHRSSKSHYLVNILRSLWMNQGFRALLIYRFGYWLSNVRKHRFGWVIVAPLYPIYWVLSVLVRNAYGINLDQSANIAAGFYINHFGGIEVRNCCIGPHCNIQQQVKLGVSETTDNRLVIGEGVYIGGHAQIRANVTIGDGATIGAGAVVTEDIPPKCLVLGNPSRITQRDYDNRSFL